MDCSFWDLMALKKWNDGTTQRERSVHSPSLTLTGCGGRGSLRGCSSSIATTTDCRWGIPRTNSVLWTARGQAARCPHGPLGDSGGQISPNSRVAVVVYWRALLFGSGRKVTVRLQPLDFLPVAPWSVGSDLGVVHGLLLLLIADPALCQTLVAQ